MKPEPQDKFQQWTIDEISYIHQTLDNHLKHHTKWTYGLVISLIGVTGTLIIIIIKDILIGG